jgi:acyl carrier protein
MKPMAKAPALAEVMSMKAVIWAQFEQVAKEQEKRLPPLSDDLVLADSDLDSLCLAIIVARLEDALGFDPFSLAEDAMFPVTLRDFVSFYETYAHGAG